MLHSNGLFGLALACGLLSLSGCPSDDTDSDTGAASSSSGTGADTGNDNGTNPPADTGPVDTGVATGNADSGTGAASTTAADTGTPDSSGDSDSSSGGNSSPAYPPCSSEPPPCPEPYEMCAGGGMGGMGAKTGSWCTLGCENADGCPDPDTGTATPICDGPMGAGGFCALDCAEGDCPDGMTCEALGGGGMFMRCTWPVGE